ncbi:hypothetical protein QJS04_geneDACA008314 [Acorus gramineus]|uniref:Transposase MuDR plant domain-containing protein n=1 Tax=Acorus gramineus TaxID=55184 RepID=A0AAV9AX23_ACOGR|nr:hypothetical protein QJS04_geneDACA008314 [Acorus gramineus]
MDENTKFRVTFVHTGQWKAVNSEYRQRYVYGKQFTETIDEDKIAMIDLWEEIGPWANSFNPRPVRFSYMLPNSLPRQYVEVDSDVKLMQLFNENRGSKKFTLYVINNEEPTPSSATLRPAIELAKQTQEESQSARQTQYVPIQPPDLQVSLVQPLPQHDPLVQPPNQHDLVVQSPTQCDSLVLDHLDPQHEEEFNFDIDDLDVEDVFLRGDDDQVMSDESKEDEEGSENVDDIDSCSDSGEVSSNKFESDFVEVDDERPNMNVGSRFPSVKRFRYALKQHCVINEFAVVYDKNEKFHVTAICKMLKCIWHIHASVLRDGVTFEVRKLNDVRMCTSVNRVGNEMASSRVLHARGKAIEIVHGSSSASYRLIPELHEELLKANPDKDKGLECGVPLVFPKVEHRTCVRHLYQNFKKKHPGELFERQMPIVDMVETIQHKIMERMHHRHGLGRKWKGKLVPKAFKYVQSIVKDIGEYIVRRSSNVMTEPGSNIAGTQGSSIWVPAWVVMLVMDLAWVG